MPHTIRTLMLFASTSWALACVVSCDPGGVGDPCVPEDEYRTSFSGYDQGEVNIESRSFQCESRLCLVDHFQGRVSCPYGQTQEDLSLPPNDPRRCRVPGTDGTHPDDAIQVPVKPWLAARPPKDSVYCSCRCDGPDADANYCECPRGFSCVELVADLKLGEREQLAGSYCVKSPNHSKLDTATCSPNLQRDNCPSPPGVNP